MDGETLLAWQGVLVLIVVATVVTVLALVIARQYDRAVAARTALHRDRAYRVWPPPRSPRSSSTPPRWPTWLPRWAS